MGKGEVEEEKEEDGEVEEEGEEQEDGGIIKMMMTMIDGGCWG